ncbi:hypothetical protein ABZ565_10615 [Streptomyces sp. NPDC016469]|uniref:hypothetical protein n=1 Tax=Streptomyces sp. NPDC016469 TaxID=3157191 RepID=UPI0033E7130F
MRTRTAAAFAAVVLLTLLGSTACSASSDGPPSSETGQATRSKPAIDPSECAVPADKTPEECEVDASFAVIEEGVPAEGMPPTAPGN